MLLYLLITFCTFILFLKSLSLKPLPQWASGMRLISFWFWKELPPIVFSGLINNHHHHISSFRISSSSRIACRNRSVCSRMENVEEMSVLDLPELALECILEKLPPSGLLSLAGVCNSLKTMCRSDHLWERHMKQKWGRVIGPAAFREWQWHIAAENESSKLKLGKQNALLGFISLLWPFSWFKSRVVSSKKCSSLPVNSTMFWYLALENGKFWFPAQVYNRENGHVGFMLSCYDAELCYDAHTDTFKARYPPHGRRAVAVENGVTWDRLRAPPVETPPHDLHISDCLNELRPGDHIEIQWRRNKDFPYGWWYGVVGHMESCDGNESYCRCHDSDTVILEFNQYSPGSRWRCSMIDRKDHREVGNEADGFYGGIRKLKNKDEISKWKYIWPNEVLE